MVDTTKKSSRLAIAAVLATALAVPAEGLRQVAYYDPPGILTACRGHTGADVKPNVRYSLDQCDQWMTSDMRAAVAKVDVCAPGLPPEVLAAFGDAVFNMGSTIACDPASSTAARYLRQYSAGTVVDPDRGLPLLRAACDQLPRWDKARVAGVMVSLPGLMKRRAAERALCLRGAA
jgi:GH24 family phage-related lysozyme (muramidase)